MDVSCKHRHGKSCNRETVSDRDTYGCDRAKINHTVDRFSEIRYQVFDVNSEADEFYTRQQNKNS